MTSEEEMADYQLISKFLPDGTPLPKGCSRMREIVWQMHGVLCPNGCTLIVNIPWLCEE